VQLSQAVKITSGVTPAPVGPWNPGRRVHQSIASRLDGVALPSGDVTFISSEELECTIR